MKSGLMIRNSSSAITIVHFMRDCSWKNIPNMTGSSELNHQREIIVRWLDDLEERFRMRHPVLMFVFEAVGFGAAMTMFLILLMLVRELP